MESRTFVQAASRTVCPSAPAILGAGECPNMPATTNLDDLEINALLIRHSDEDPLLLLSFDLLYIGPMLMRIINDAFDWIPKDRVLALASHTHRAPMIDETKPRLGAFSNEYLEQLGVAIGSISVELADGGRLPVRMFAGTSEASHAINRRLRKRLLIARKPGINRYVNAPNPSGMKDETIITLRWLDHRGNTIAVLWNYACHPVGHPVKNSVTSHFPGRVRSALRAEYGASVSILFAQGFSGDTRPSATKNVRGIKRRLRRMIVGPIFSDMSGRDYLEWVSGLSARVIQSIAHEVEIHVDTVLSSYVGADGSEFVNGWNYEVGFWHARLGQEVELVAVGAEVVTGFAAYVANLVPEAKYLLKIGCAGPTFGYLPTQEILRQGGYEAGGYTRSFGLGPINQDIDLNMRATLARLLGRS